jgi:demethylspheroidene O-methyltransferase
MADGAMPEGAAQGPDAVPVAAPDMPRPLRPFRPGWLARLIARPDLQAAVARVPLLRRIARRDGAALFDLLAGFVRAQVLLAVVELDLPARLMDGPRAPGDLARETGLTPDRMEILLQAAAALKLLRRRRDGRFALARQGAALAGVPGLAGMIRHHGAFYGDMADPVALLRGTVDTDLARFWPYVFGATGSPPPPEVTRAYSDLMADSQTLVAQDTLATVRFGGVRRVLDVGGGSGAFAVALCGAQRKVEATVFDLPGVAPLAAERIAAAGLGGRVSFVPGSFRHDPLPRDCDMITLVRVLYDHADATVADLLARAFAALPPGGRLVISEPMAGGARPDPAGDVYFAFYTLAMRTGRARSAERIAALCRAAGFTDLRCHTPRRAFVTSVVEARKPS